MQGPNSILHSCSWAGKGDYKAEAQSQQLGARHSSPSPQGALMSPPCPWRCQKLWPALLWLQPCAPSFHKLLTLCP